MSIRMSIDEFEFSGWFDKRKFVMKKHLMGALDGTLSVSLLGEDGEKIVLARLSEVEMAAFMAWIKDWANPMPDGAEKG